MGHLFYQLKKYFPPVLWPDFSILITVKPEELEGGFIFAAMDRLESVIQFGVSLSAGVNDYTQTIQLWYTEYIERVSRNYNTYYNTYVLHCISLYYMFSALN